MKTRILFVAIILFSILRLDAQSASKVSAGFFYESLRPYGDWIRLDNDVVVWHPNGFHAGWRPYMAGNWSWTDNGWYFDSDEPFGWATYHYGRWYYDDHYGWLWVPDDQWGPSWVEWRYNDDYIGWAPLPPYASFHLDLGIHFSIGWHSNYRYWNFVGYNHFCDRHVRSYLIDERRCEKIFNATRYRTNYYSDHNRIINGGIDRSFVERRGGYRIEPREIRTVENFNELSRNRSDRAGIVAYRPSEKEFGAAREFDNNSVRRGEAKTSLERDKIVFREKTLTDETRSGLPRTESSGVLERNISRSAARNLPARDAAVNIRRERESIGVKNQRESVRSQSYEKQQRSERPLASSSSQRPQSQERRVEQSRQSNQVPRSANSSRSVTPQRGKTERDRK
jgi:hypothetical protein